MPPAPVLPGMLCELAVYGLVTGLLIRLVHTKRPVVGLYIALVGAMLCGRVVSGILNALIFRAGKYSMEVWLTSAFVKAVPGILIQLIFVPLLVIALQKARLIKAPAKA